jgi:ABC-2 type transport system ATP-binding protein
MTSIVVEAENLKKYFAVDRSLYEQVLAPFAAKKIVRALDGVSFSIERGEILGIVGPNGAGKTTLLRILANLLEADRGRVKLCGQELNNECHARAHIGYVSCDERSFFWRLSGKQNLEFFAGLYGLSKQLARKRIAQLLDKFGLEEKAAELFRDYSTGTRKKFALARALTHQPRVLLLDEVTNSLDVPSAQSVKALVREYVSVQPGRVAVWSTHRFEEIGEICDKVLVISEGRMKFFGTINDLKCRGDDKNCHLGDENMHEEVTRYMNAIFADGG